MGLLDKEGIEAGRKAVFEYRSVHDLILNSLDNTFFVHGLIDKILTIGYSSLEHFFQCSRQYNIEELGFATEDEMDAVIYDPKTDEIVDEKLLAAFKDMWW